MFRDAGATQAFRGLGGKPAGYRGEACSHRTAAAAAALGLNLRFREDPVDEIAVSVENRRVLIVLDNCEHLVDLAAAFVEALLASAQGITIIATSREPLRTGGEWVHQLSPLDAPPES